MESRFLPQVDRLLQYRQAEADDRARGGSDAALCAACFDKAIDDIGFERQYQAVMRTSMQALIAHVDALSRAGIPIASLPDGYTFEVDLDEGGRASGRDEASEGDWR